MVQGKLQRDLVAQLTVHDHTFVSGLAEKLGGHDEGPDPHELLEAALVACTILTAQLYAQRRGLKLVSTDVQVRIVSEGAETRIAREVTFQGELTDEEKQKLFTIIEKCPIHRLLESNVKIETTQAGA